jgi:hypothetical protein
MIACPFHASSGSAVDPGGEQQRMPPIEAYSADKGKDFVALEKNSPLSGCFEILKH